MHSTLSAQNRIREVQVLSWAHTSSKSNKAKTKINRFFTVFDIYYIYMQYSLPRIELERCKSSPGHMLL